MNTAVLARPPGSEATQQVSQTNAPEAPAPPKRTRLEHLDALKVALIVLVVAHHAGQAFGPTGGAWPLYNAERAPILDQFFTVNAAFFMGLFFLISAYFLPASFEHKGPARYLTERFVRLGAPIAVLLVGGFVYAFSRSLSCRAKRPGSQSSARCPPYSSISISPTSGSWTNC